MSRIVGRNVLVEFPIYGTKARSLKTVALKAATGGLLSTSQADQVTIRALNGIDFDFREGDRIGLIGHNGSGKSTLLRVIAGAYEPVTGTVEVDGRVASMLSITLGLDMDATGYENIFLRGAILGLKRSQILPLVDDICEFAELGDYIRVPMRTYSTGMAMRLAFAVSTSVPADIVLMDEWLSVGDESFANKARIRLTKMVDRAKILVLASHSDLLLHQLCNQIVRLDHGSITEIEKVVAPPEPI